jgi:hypothetical protein
VSGSRHVEDGQTVVLQVSLSHTHTQAVVLQVPLSAFSRILTYAHVCSRMLAYAGVRTYADVCGRMLADVC